MSNVDFDDWELDEQTSGRSVRYEKIKFLGEGQYATVWKAKDIEGDTIVAIKKINQGTSEEIRDGINRTAIREIKLLRELRHENVIGLLDVFGGQNNVNLVVEFMETDLENIIREPSIIITPAIIKRYSIMTLRGVQFLHQNWILHRDLKPNNLLIDPKGILKIGDFGLARYYGSPRRPLTSDVVTRWYRCPELLFGARMYGTGVDLWAVGCIIAELLLRHPLFPGDSDFEQLSRIFTVTGTPTEKTWPNVEKLRSYVQFKPMPKMPLENVLVAAQDDLLEVVGRMLVLNPTDRVTASGALQLPFFSNHPAPTKCSKLPKKSLISGDDVQSRLKRKSPNNDSGCTAAKRLIFE